MSRLRVAIALAVLGVCAASGQEALSAILERGYVAHWLVCGPFAADVDGGIAEALRRGSPALGSADRMAPVGGIARLRPQHLLRVRTEQGEAIWQRAGTRGPALDLGPFFPEAREGVAYAGFYAESETARPVLMELHTHLGARVYVNGALAREIGPATFPAGGVQVYPVTMAAGMNFVVAVVPGVRHEVLAEFLGTPVETVRERHLRNRPLLTGASGFEIGLTLRPVEALGELMYVPQLEMRGAMAREGDSVRPVGVLTIYNGGTTTSQPVRVVARSGNTSTSAVVPPIAPGASGTADVTLPGDGNAVVELSAGDAAAHFTMNTDAPVVTEAGTVHFLSGAYEFDAGDAPPRERISRYDEALKAHLRLLSEPAYGFDLGPAAQWSAAVQSNAAGRPVLRDALIALRTAPHLEMAGVDARLVGDEVLARDVLYGYQHAAGLLDVPGRVYFAWNAPAIAPQMPQILRSPGGLGLVSSVPAGGLPPIFAHLGLDGSRVLHRRKTAGPGPSTLDDLRAMAKTQRQELLSVGIASDILVNQSVGVSPEPFLLGAAEPMTRWVPALKLSSVGAEDFFRGVEEGLARGAYALESQAHAMNRVSLGEMIAQPAIKQAYRETEQLAVLAERAATAAAMLGARYPSRSMDHAWRQLITLGTPATLGYAATDTTAADVLAGCREAAAVAREVLENSLAYIAGETDTIGAAPVRGDQARAVVVFNPSPWTRTDVCEVRVEGLGAPSFSVTDDARGAVACEVTREGSAPGSPDRLTGRFVAREVPGFGWRTYYLVPQREGVAPMHSESMQIENEFFWVTVEPESGGAITSVVDKATGRELSGGLWNDVALLSEDASQGRQDLWTTGVVERASGRRAEIEVTKHAAVQTIRVKSAIGGGSVTRVVRVYPGLPRIDCTLEVDGVALGSRMLALVSDVNPEGRAPVMGERFGAIVGRYSASSLDFRSREAENASGSGLQPALRWAALAPGDSLVSGLDAVAPLESATIVIDAAGTMADAAAALQKALAKRGVPCAIARDVPAARNAKWGDATTFINPNDDARNGCGMRIVLGGPEQNAMAKQVLMQAPQSAMTAFNERLGAGVCMLLDDGYVGEGLAPVPTLVIGGSTAGAVAQQAQRMATDLQETGRFQIPRELFVPRRMQRPADDGLALLHPGAFLFSAEADGSMVIALAHAEQTPVQLAYRYAFYPFTGTWQESRVARAGHEVAEPLACTVTDLHVSRQRSSTSLLAIEGDGIGVTAIKPSETPEAAFSARETRVSRGVMARVYETRGTSALGEIVAYAPMRGAYESTLIETMAKPIEADVNRAGFSLAPFEVKSLVFEPSTRVPQGDPKSLESNAVQDGPHMSRYWRQNRWTSTAGTMPVGIALEGNVNAASSTVALHIASNCSDTPVQGTVRLFAPDDWHLSGHEFPFNLGPREGAVNEITVMRKFPSEASGGILASVEYQGQQFFDVIQVDAAPCRVETAVEGSRLSVLVENTGRLPAMCRVEANAPPEYWPELNPAGNASVMPRVHTATIPVQGQQRFVFRLDGVAPGTPVMVKAAVNDSVRYERVVMP